MLGSWEDWVNRTHHEKFKFVVDDGQKAIHTGRAEGTPLQTRVPGFPPISKGRVPGGEFPQRAPCLGPRSERRGEAWRRSFIIAITCAAKGKTI